MLPEEKQTIRLMRSWLRLCHAEGRPWERPSKG